MTVFINQQAKNLLEFRCMYFTLVALDKSFDSSNHGPINHGLATLWYR